jgi:hypothetical protein
MMVKKKITCKATKMLLVRHAALPVLHTNNGGRFNNLNE